MADSTVGVYNQRDIIELEQLFKSIGPAIYLYFEESRENTLNIIENVIVKFNCRNDKEIDEIIELINQKSDKKYCKSSILQLYKRFIFIWREIDCSKLQLINRSFPFCEKLGFDLKYSKDLEIVTNPILYQNGIESFELNDTNNILHFSDKFISNICEIKPKNILIKSENFEYKKRIKLYQCLAKTSQ